MTSTHRPILVAALIAGLVSTALARPPDVAFVRVEPYEAPARPLPIPSAEPPAGVRDLIGYPAYLVARDAYRKLLEKREVAAKAYDEAYEAAILAHAAWWTELVRSSAIEKGKAQARALARRVELAYRLIQLHEADETCRAAAREMYAKFELVFRIAGESEQKRLLTELDTRLDELVKARRRVIALMQHQRHRFDDRMARAEGADPRRPPTDAEIADAARATLGSPNLRRAYVWLVPETALHLEVHDRLLELRDEVLQNTVVHRERLAAYRATPGPGPHVPRPPSEAEKVARLEQVRLRFRRLKLRLVRREIQAEAIFTRATSMMATTGRSLHEFLSKSATVLTGLQRNGRVDEESITGGVGEQIVVTFAGEAALLRRLAGDLFGTVVVDPLLDRAKNRLTKPLLHRIGYEVRDSIDQAFDAYSKESAAVRARIAVVDAIVRDETWAGARAVVRWAMERTAPAPPPTSVAGRAKTFDELRADVDLMEAAGGPLGAYAPAATTPGEVAAIHVATARDLLHANVRAGLVRVATARGLAADVGDGLEPTESLLHRVIHPLALDLTLERKLDARAGYLANWAALVYEAPKTIVSDWVLGAIDRWKTYVSYRAGEAASQDAYLKGLARVQRRFDDVVSALVRVGFDFDRLRARRDEWLEHMAVRSVSHEYLEALRRIRRARFERELLWLQARHEVVATRDGVAPKLDDVGRYAMADAKARLDIDQAWLAERGAWRRLRYLAFTGDHAGAAAQVEALEKIHEHWLAINQRPADIDFSAVAEGFRVEAVRADVIAIYQELWRIAITEMAISFASAKLAEAYLEWRGAGGAVQFHPAAAGPGGWSVARQKVWETLNPWAGKFTVGGVYGTLKGVTVDTLRDAAVTIGAAHQSLLAREDLDAMLDFAFSVVDGAHETIQERALRASHDDQADEELFRERTRSAKKLRDELARAEADGDDATARRVRAALMVVTGDLEATDDRTARLREEAERQAIRIVDEMLGRDVEEESASRTADDGGEPFLLEEAARRAEALHAHERLHDESVAAADLDPLLSPDDPTGLQGRLFHEGLDVQSLRTAMSRAAMNDPEARTRLLAQAMALDLLRTRRTDALVEQFLRDTEWGGRVDVLREGNYVAVVDGDVTAPGRRDVPGLHVDLELDFVLRGGADDAELARLREAFHDYLVRRGYERPAAEGRRTSLGARFHFQTREQLEKGGRKSRVHVPAAKLYEKERLAEPRRKVEDIPESERRRLEISDDLAYRLEKERGFERSHAKRMSLLAQLFDGILVVRNGNPTSVPYMDGGNYLAKDMTCKAKTAKVGDHVGLVVNPRHAKQAKAWDDAIGAAKAKVETARTSGGDVAAAERELAGLERNRKRAEDAWDTYGAEMQSKYGYIVTDEGLVTKAGYDGIHGDYDLHGLFFEGEDGRMVRASLGNGEAADNAKRALRLEQLNGFLGASKEMFLHGAQDDWKHAGKTSDPPVTVFLSDELAAKLGVKSPVFLDTPEEMRAFYQQKLGVRWEYADGANDLAPPEKLHVPTGYKGGRFRSVGGARWRANRRGASLPWVPVPVWQTYGIALDLAPRLDALVDPAYEPAALASAPNLFARRERLRVAYRDVGAFLALFDAWVIAQPRGNVLYNGASEPDPDAPRLDRRRWRDAFATRDDRIASDESAPLVVDADRARLRRRAEEWAGRLPDGWAARVVADVRALVDTGGTSLAADDVARLERVARVYESGRRLDPFAPLGDGTLPSALDEATELLGWMRRIAPTLYADIGFESARELRRMELGMDSEYRYARNEALRVAGALRAIVAESPSAALAFARPPFSTSGARAPLDRAFLLGAIRSDVARVLAGRRRRAPAVAPRSPVAPPSAASRSPGAQVAADRVESWIRVWESFGEPTR